MGFLLQVAAFARISAAAAGIAYCIEPVVTAVASVFVLGQTLDPFKLSAQPSFSRPSLPISMLERQPAALLVPTD